MKYTRSASRYPLKGATLAVRQSRPGGALDYTDSCVGVALSGAMKN